MRLRLDDPTTWPELTDAQACSHLGVLLWQGQYPASWLIAHLSHENYDWNEDMSEKRWDTTSPLVWQDAAVEYPPFPAKDGDWWQELPPPPGEEVEP